MKLESRLSRLEASTPTRDDSETAAERLRAALNARIEGIAERRRSAADYLPPPPMTPEQRAALRAQLDARLQACCPGGY